MRVFSQLITRIKSKLSHEHKYDIFNSKEVKVGLNGGRHTSFVVFKCTCGNKIVFPEDNFDLAVLEGTESTLKLIKGLGLMQ